MLNILQKLHRMGRPDLSSMNAWYAGYIMTVPALAGSLMTVMIAGAGLWGAINATWRRYDFRLPRRALPFIAACLLCFSVYALTGLIQPNVDELPNKLQPFALLLLTPFLIARFRAFDPDWAWVMARQYAPLGSAAGLVAFLVSGWDAGGAGNQNVFGVAMTVLGMFSLLGAMSADDREKLLGFAGYLIAVLAVVLSQTRTMLPPLVLLAILAVFMGQGLGRRWVLGGGALLIVILIVLGPRISAQVMSAIDDVQTLEATDQIKPVAARIALWTASWKAILAHPWMGYGIQNKMDVVFGLIDTKMKLPAHSHVHNEFLDAMVSGGIIALLAFVAMLATPLWMIAGLAGSRQRDFIILGTVLIFGVRSLTGNLLTHDLVLSLFLFPLIMAAATDPRTRELVLWRGQKPGPSAGF